jgi:hypothetical protein
VELSVGIGPLRQRWIAEHQGFLMPKAGQGDATAEFWQFQDVQVQGPFAHWIHTHKVEADGNNACYLEDRIEYALPWGRIGDWIGNPIVISKLKRLFTYRHRVTANDAAYQSGPKGDRVMKILVTGSTGFMGSALVPFLTTSGHQVSRLFRSKSKKFHGMESAISWNPEAGVLDLASLEGFDAVIHLAGESIAGGRWSSQRKTQILESRSKGTRLLSETLSRLSHPPKVLISASAIGYYGDRGEERLNEQSSPGSDFLAKVCQEWEKASTAASDAGIRVLNLRFGIVLSTTGGALQRMVTPFRLGVGGIIGNGSQFMSWIALDELLGVIQHTLVTDQLRGPINVASPNPVTNREFTKTLGRILGRPTILPMPAFAAKLAFGEMAEALLLSSQRIEPQRLLQTGYSFRFPELEGALRYLLGK